jgi:uncharacterized protein (DUF1800 family)
MKTLLGVALLTTLGPLTAAAQTTAGARAEAVHVLNRLTFGPRPGDVERVLALGIGPWIEQQLSRSIDEAYDAAYPGCAAWVAPLDGVGEAASTMVRSGFSVSLVRRGEMPTPARFEMRQRAAALYLERRTPPPAIRSESVQLTTCRLMRMERAEEQLREVLTDFWLNHFSVYSRLVPDRASLVAYERAIHARALGSFRDLLGAVAHSPAMLMYLDNHTSAAGPNRLTLTDLAWGRTTSSYHELTHLGLNENYGRELLELHTLGVNGGYTQNDVVNAARAFTGWSHTAWRRGCIERPDPITGRTPICRILEPKLPQFYFDSAAHDAERKTILGHTLAEGRGVEDGEQVLDILAAHPSAAQHIARKLAVRFVSDAPPQELVDRAAETFTRTHGDIREVMRTIVTSREFQAAKGTKLRTPIELVLSIRRAIDAPYDTDGDVVERLIDLDQMPFNNIAPDGWPETAAGWMNTGSLVSRVNFARAAAFGEVKSIPIEKWQHWKELTTLPYEQQVDRVITLLLHDNVTPQLRSALLAAAPKQPEKPGSIAAELSLRNLISLVLGSPDFQRR